MGERQEVTVPGETPRGNGPRSVSGRFVSNANPIAVQSPRTAQHPTGVAVSPDPAEDSTGRRRTTAVSGEERIVSGAAISRSGGSGIGFARDYGIPWITRSQTGSLDGGAGAGPGV